MGRGFLVDLGFRDFSEPRSMCTDTCEPAEPYMSRSFRLSTLFPPIYLQLHATSYRVGCDPQQELLLGDEGTDGGVPSMQTSKVITRRPEDMVWQDSLIKRHRWHFAAGATYVLK